VEDEPTPLIFDEFRDICNSEYLISDKDSDSAISSDGEFMDACKIQIYEETDSHIDQIEVVKENKRLLRDSIYQQGIDYKQPRFVQMKQFANKKVNQKEYPLNHS
jgi:hypothetical protein